MELPKDKVQLEEVLNRAVRSFYERQPDVFKFTEETGPSEWNLAYHFSQDVAPFIPYLDLDVELLKRSHNNMRPDIVFHRRGVHKSNYLVIELKRDGSPSVIAKDVAKIREHWFRKPLSYQFGAAINLCANGIYEIQVLENVD